MAGLLDIGPLTEEVEVCGVTVTVRGLTAGHIFQLFSQFPDIRKLFEAGGDVQSVMLQLAPDLIARTIAMVCPSEDADPKLIEAKAKELGAADQLKILMAAQRLSFRDGIGPFVEQVTSLMGPVSVPELDPILKPSEGSTNSSRPPYSASLQTDTPNLAHGRAPRVN